MTLESEIPMGAGMGSSAAWGASLSAAFLHSLYFILSDGTLFDKSREKEFVWSYTNFIEQLYHGSPSGCDAAVTMTGDCIFYQKGTPPNLTQIKKLQKCKIDKQNMIIVNTNAKKNTKVLV